MQKNGLPFNIEMLILNDAAVAHIRPVTSLDIYVGATKQLHPDGLYSNEIFGMIGTVVRETRISYIDLKVPVIHPIIYESIVKSSDFYRGILTNKEFATWNPTTKCFDKSDIVDGETGYNFFTKHINELEIGSTGSTSRSQLIKLLSKNKGKYLTDKLVVIPAALRDVAVDATGRTTSDEINEIYYRLISIANTINKASVKFAIESFDQQRISLQNKVNEVYNHIKTILEGKNGFLQRKFMTRNVFDTTRNVMSAMALVSSRLNDPRTFDINDTAIGLFQAAKALRSRTLYNLRNGFLSEVFANQSSQALLCDPKTKKSIRADVHVNTFNAWGSSEGLEKLLTHFREESMRHDPIMIDGYYLGLTYIGSDKTFAFIHSIEDLPPSRKKDGKVEPITYAELLYAAVYVGVRDYPLFLTRYPITGAGSIYPSNTHLRTTANSLCLRELDANTWEPKYKESALEFPLRGEAFFNSMSPHPSKLQGLGGDFDGDTCSGNIAISEEAKEEWRNLKAQRHFYVGSDNKFTNQLGTDTVKFMLRNVTGRKKYKD